MVKASLTVRVLFSFDHTLLTHNLDAFAANPFEVAVVSLKA